jgi:hypothetical protein
MDLTFGGISITIKSGALISVLLMVPNAVWMLWLKAGAGEQGSASLLLTIIENAGRAAVLLLPFFYSLDLNKKHSTLVITGMGLALTVYYASWIRYFVGGRSAELFGAPLFGIPLPMAVAPTAFLILSSYLMGSWLMFGASILFGIAHIWVSAISL